MFRLRAFTRMYFLVKSFRKCCSFRVFLAHLVTFPTTCKVFLDWLDSADCVAFSSKLAKKPVELSRNERWAHTRKMCYLASWYSGTKHDSTNGRRRQREVWRPPDPDFVRPPQPAKVGSRLSRVVLVSASHSDHERMAWIVNAVWTTVLQHYCILCSCISKPRWAAVDTTPTWLTNRAQAWWLMPDCRLGRCKNPTIYHKT